MNPAVSVILPCYNAHRFLPEALDSVRAQTYRDREIIVVDDGSTDPDTRAYLDRLPADVELVRQENRGLAGARNTGFRAARGRYVLPLDCDDTIAPDFLERTVAALEADPSVAFAFAWIEMVGERRGVLEKHWNFFEQLFLNQLPYCMLVRKSAWRAVGGYDESFRHGYEDWAFNIALGAAGYRAAVIPAPLFRYRVSAGGMLGAIARPRHGKIWASIQGKNRDLYRPASLLRLWREWRGRPSTYPPAFCLAYFAMHRLLPDRVFAGLLQRLMAVSHSHRAGTPVT